MNNQIPQSHGKNWRPHNYTLDADNHAFLRPDNFYSHYPAEHYVDDYIEHGYGYPGMMPPYRPAEYPTPPSNAGSYNSFGLMTPQAYTEYYYKIEAYLLQNDNYKHKDYEDPSTLFGQTPFFRNVDPLSEASHHHKHHPIQAQNTYPAGQLNIIQKTKKTDDVILIESNQQNAGVVYRIQYIQSQLRRTVDDLNKQNKQLRMLMQLPQKQKQHQAIHLKQFQSGRDDAFPPINPDDVSQKVPSSQIVPLQVIQQLQQQILEELQNASLPDDMMKLFLRYKTVETSSKYQQNEQMSIKIINLLKIYRAIIWFQKQRKLVMEDKFAEYLFGDLKVSNPGKNTQSVLNDLKIDKFCLNLDPSHMKNSLDDLEQLRDLKKQKKYCISQNFLGKTKKISKKQLFDQDSWELYYNSKAKFAQKYQIQGHKNQVSQRKLRQRKKRKHKKQKKQQSLEGGVKQKIPEEQKSKKQKKKQLKHQKIANKKIQNRVQLSNEDQVYIQKIERWAQKTLTNTIKEKDNVSLGKRKTIAVNQNTQKGDPFKVIKNNQCSQSKKQKQRSTKASEYAFKQMLLHKVSESKQIRSHAMPNFITFSTSNNLSEVQKQQYQKQLSHLQRQLRNNDSHGKIRIGKQYYQARMPAFALSQRELDRVIEQKRQKLVERKMSVLTF